MPRRDPIAVLSHRSLIHLGLILLLASVSGCSRAQQAESARPTPSIAASPEILSNDYPIWTAKRSTYLRTGLNSSLNLVNGTMVAAGEVYPDPTAIQRDEKQLTREMKDFALTRARQELANTLLSQPVRHRRLVADVRSLRDEMRLDPQLRQRVEQLLRAGPKIAAKKTAFNYKVTLSLNLRQHPWLYDRMIAFNEESYALPYYRGIPPRKLQDGGPFPAFSLRDVQTDRLYPSDSLPGKALLLMFWLPDDYASVWQLANMEKLHRQYSRKGLTVLGIVSAGARKDAQEAVASRAVTFPNLYDDQSDLSKRVGAGIHPYYILVSRFTDQVVFQGYGTVPGNFSAGTKMTKFINDLLAHS